MLHYRMLDAGIWEFCHFELWNFFSEEEIFWGFVFVIFGDGPRRS